MRVAPATHNLEVAPRSAPSKAESHQGMVEIEIGRYLLVSGKWFAKRRTRIHRHVLERLAARMSKFTETNSQKSNHVLHLWQLSLNWGLDEIEICSTGTRKCQFVSEPCPSFGDLRHKRLGGGASRDRDKFRIETCLSVGKCLLLPRS